MNIDKDRKTQPDRGGPNEATTPQRSHGSLQEAKEAPSAGDHFSQGQIDQLRTMLNDFQEMVSDRVEARINETTQLMNGIVMSDQAHEQRTRMMFGEEPLPQVGTQPILVDQEEFFREEANQARQEELEARRHNRLLQNDRQRRLKSHDVSLSIAKAWQTKPIHDDMHAYPEWNRKALAYFASVGLTMFSLMDGFKAPKTLNAWAELDRRSRGLPEFADFQQDVLHFGEIQAELTREEPMDKLNAAYLAVVDNKQGLRASVTAIIESCIDFKTMKNCLPRASDMGHPAAARLMYFNVFNYFQLNTRDTRIKRLSEFTSNSRIVDPESIKNFADRLQAEAEVLNMMSAKEVIPPAILLGVFEKAVTNRFGDSNIKYYTEQRLLQQEKPDYTLEDIVNKWEDVFQTEKGLVDHSTVNAYAVQPPSSFKPRDRHGNNLQPRFAQSRQKVQRDKEGKPVCFQFVKRGTCTFGQSCKYSHNAAESKHALMCFSEQEIEDIIIQQAFYAGAPRHTKPRSHRGKERDRETNKGRHKPTANTQPSFQSAVRNHNNRTESKTNRNHGARANVAVAQEPNDSDEETHDDGQVSDSSESSDVSSSSIEYCMMTPAVSLAAKELEGKQVALKASQAVDHEPSWVLNVTAKDNFCSGILDSGATTHICGRRDMFVGQLRPCRMEVRCANNESVVAAECGDVVVKFSSDDGNNLTLRDVLFVPEWPFLISLSKMAEDCSVNFLFKASEKTCDVLNEHTGECLTTIPQSSYKDSKKLFVVKLFVPKQAVKVSGKARRQLVFAAYQSGFVPRLKNIHQIHLRYNHVSEPYCRKLAPRAGGKLPWCDACVVGGLKKRRFKKRTHYESANDHNTLQQDKDFALSAVDVSSTEPTGAEDYGYNMAWDAKTSAAASVRGYKYAFTGICLNTRLGLCIFGRSKSDFEPQFTHWLAGFHNKYKTYPVQLLFDQGGENVSTHFLQSLKDKGIAVKFSTAGSSNQNAHVERKIGINWTAMLKLLAHSGVPYQFWCYAYEYAVLVGNHIPHRALNFRQPVEVAGFTPLHDRIFVWGCEAWHVDKYRMAHESKSSRGVLLGIHPEIKGWQILDIATRKVIVTRDVVFNESRFPFRDHMEPCVIMLKFGTWPKLKGEQTVSLPAVNPITVAAQSSGECRKGGQFDDEFNDYVSDVPAPTEEVSAKHESDETMPLEGKTLVSPEGKVESKTGVSPGIEPSEPISPIFGHGWDSELLTPPRVQDEAEATLDFGTPTLRKGAQKRWKKFKDNHYKLLPTLHTQKHYERKLSKQIVPDKPPPPSPLTPIPEGDVDGKPAWEIMKVSKARLAKEGDGSKEYYVRWKGNWPDQWLHERHLLGSKDLLEEFNRPRKRGRKAKRPKNSKPDPEVQEGVAIEVKGPSTRSKKRLILKHLKTKSPKPPVRRSARLAGHGYEAVHLASSEFPPPPNYELDDHPHLVPHKIREDQVIAEAFTAVEELVVDEQFEKKPLTRSEMLAGNRVQEYKVAEERELAELQQNGTFEICECPRGRRPIPCRWVYDIKRNSKGEIERYKARLVIQGFRQIEGVDYQQTFSAVSQMRTFRLLVAIAVTYNLRITQYDISNAFLHADLDKEIYMTFPPGYPPESGERNLVFKLLKGLYGLKQASRLWSKELAKAFKEAGLDVAQTEPGVFFVKGGPLCIVNCHVDDYNVCTGNEELRKRIEEVMSKAFSVKSLGELELFLGITIEQIDEGDTVGLKLHQGPYHNRAIEKYGLGKAKPAPTPAEVSIKLSITDSPETDEKGRPINPPEWPYMNVGGTLMYSACATRPDIAQRVMQLARYNKNPGLTHVKAQKHVLRFLRSNPERGIRFTRSRSQDSFDGPLEIIAFCDADWAGCPDTRRTTVGFVILIAGGPVSWKSQLKKTLALSSCEAEFMALTEVARELMWLIRFLDEVGIRYSTPKIYCDSQSAIYWSEDPVQHQRNKHVELKYYFIRDVVGQQLVKVFKINTKYNVADLMTKPTTRAMGEELIPPLMGEKGPTLEE